MKKKAGNLEKPMEQRDSTILTPSEIGALSPRVSRGREIPGEAPKPTAPASSDCKPLNPVNPDGLNKVAEGLLRAADANQVKPQSNGTVPSAAGSAPSDERMRSACREFGDVGRRLSEWIKKQPSVGEESLTDWMLYELSERIRWIRYRKFTRHEEARSVGADWEWWIVGRQLSLGLRVQAKKVVDGADHYRGLAHTNRDGLQIERLMERCKRDNLLAFYALYHCPTSVSSVMCRGNLQTNSVQGVFLVSAIALYEKFIRAGRSQVAAGPLLALSNPLSCFLCCPLAGELAPDGAIPAYRYLREYYPESIATAPPNQRAGQHREPPAYVLSLLESPAGEVPDWWEGEFRFQTQDINALLVFDMRE